MSMKIVVIGGTGLIGSQVVKNLKAKGHEVIAASPKSGVDTLSGKGLSEALKGARVVIDVSNSPSFAETEVMNFFTTSTNNLLKHSKDAGVEHFVALSVVGTQRVAHLPYFHAKAVQESLIVTSRIPYSIVHATQFFEFYKGIADSAVKDDKVRLPPIQLQPMASEDVAKAVAIVSEGAPLNGIVEVAGPEKIRVDDFARIGLKAINDKREVVTDKDAIYFGAPFDEGSLCSFLPAESARVGELRFSDWLARTAKAGQ